MCFSGETANIDVAFVPLILPPVISSPSSGDLLLKLLISIICTRGVLEELRKLKSLKKKHENQCKKTDTKNQDIPVVQNYRNLTINKSYSKQVVLINGCCIPVIKK